MRITADKDIPFLRGVFEPYADVVFMDGRSIKAQDIAESDALIIRTRTRCDAQLLGGSPVQMIATATIGTDHIDLPWCSSHGIEVSSALGCNAGGVMQYVFTALYAVAQKKSISLKGRTIGIIGVGHVGSRIADMAQKLGFRVLLCDPPRSLREGPEKFCTLERLLSESDIVTMHTWLDESTRGMADDAFFASMRDGAIFINASRGDIVCNEALLRALPRLGGCVIDTWAGEPDIDRALLAAVDIATMHIAGYSWQGKQNGTSMAVRAIARHFGIDQLMNFTLNWAPEGKEISKIDFSSLNHDEIACVLQEKYPIFEDDRMLRTSPESFEQLRCSYDYRGEIALKQ